MKRVVGGKAYNADTAQTIAVAEDTYEKNDRDWLSRNTLYRTPKGAWFVVEEDWPEEERGDPDDVRIKFRIIRDLDHALEWVRGCQCEIKNDEYFPAIEEA